MRVTAGNGIEVSNGRGTLFLDPKKAHDDGIVTHAHSDHLTAGGRMTPPTLDFLRVRKPARSASPLAYGKDADVAGFSVRLHDAGHILGSAMVEAHSDAQTLLYTGDFNPVPGFTTGRAEPTPCDVLVTESTYGDPRFDLPPRELVIESLEAWMLQKLVKGPVALGAYPLGRAQELIHLANRAGIVPIVSPEVGALTAVYNSHGHDLAYAVQGTDRAADLDAQGGLHVVGRESLKREHPFARSLVQRGGAGAYLSGWCHRYSYFSSYAIDAQFTLSDHAGYRDLLSFIGACRPKMVYTTHGAMVPLARAIREELGIKAEPLATRVAVEPPATSQARLAG